MPDIKQFTTIEMSLVNTAVINQKQLLRLHLAAQILTGIVIGDDILCTKDPDACRQNKEAMVGEAVEYADLLLKKITESAD